MNQKPPQQQVPQIDPTKNTLDLLLDPQNKAKLISQFDAAAAAYFQTNDSFNLLNNPTNNNVNVNSNDVIQSQWLNSLNDFNRLNPFSTLANQSLSFLSNSLAQSKLGGLAHPTNNLLPPGVFGFSNTNPTSNLTPDLIGLNQSQPTFNSNDDQFNLQSQLIDSLKINVNILFKFF